MCPRVLFLPAPNCGRRSETNRREGRRGILSARTKLYLTDLQLEKIRDQSEVLEDFSGKHWITKLHESSFASISQCHLTLKNCTHLLHLKKRTSEKFLPLNDNFNLHWYCRASITWTQRDHRLFITALVTIKLSLNPRRLRQHVDRKPCRRDQVLSLHARTGVCVGASKRKWMWGFFHALTLFCTCKNTHHPRCYAQPR